jgi:hypothetical protein
MVSDRQDDSAPEPGKPARSGAPYSEEHEKELGTAPVSKQRLGLAGTLGGAGDSSAGSPNTGDPGAPAEGSPNDQGSDAEAARFKKRLLALVGGPTEHFQKILLGQSNPQSRQLSTLIEEFDRFARSYFDFFLKGKPINSLPQDLTTALTRLQTEAENINRACQQRDNAEFSQFLAQADELAKIYYKQFNGYKVDPAALPITYFDKLFGIRRSPYSPYPLLSIPLLVFNDPSQWAGGLAHELGHYIYWNSSALKAFGTIRPRLESAVLRALSISHASYAAFEVGAKVADIWIGWLEETFADICGTLLVGPSFVASGQQLAEDLGASQNSDDGEHPAPFIRPLIAIETLRWVAEQPSAAAQRARLQAIIQVFDERWAKNRRLGRRLVHEDSGLKMAEVERRVGLVVRSILGSGNGMAGAGTWVGADGQTPADLGPLFDCTAWLNDLPAPEEAAAALTRIDFSNKAYDTSHSSASFEELLSYLKGRFSSEKEVRQALLLFELEEERGEVCKSRTVVRVGVGKGDYQRC